MRHADDRKIRPRLRRYGLMLLGLTGIAVLMPACATTHPWERSELADPLMELGRDALEEGMRDQHREYREGSAGGSRTQGGGCGCG